MTKAMLLIACLWLALSGALAGTARAESAPPALMLSASPFVNKDVSLNFSVESLRLTPFKDSLTSVLEQTDNVLRGLQARYKMSLMGESLELSGGYVPGSKAVISSEPKLDPDAYLGYVNLKIPLHRFYFNSGAFFGQNMDALSMTIQGRSDEQGLQRSFLGYHLGGGYKFSDKLSIEAGWGQAAQEDELSRDDLRAWYLQAQISLGLSTSITPQMGFVDSTKDDGQKTKEEAFYCGVRWQINF